MTRKKKIWRRKFATIAANDRRFTVKNNTVPKSDKEYFMIPYSSKNTDTTGKYWFVPGVPGTMFIKNDKPDPETGNHYTLVDHSWKQKKSPQLASSWLEVIDGKPTLIKSTDLHRDPKKMNHVEYMEKLTQHKLAKWERKHPRPCKDDDLFKEEMIPLWEDERRKAEERLRDFVVSIYDKLPLVGRFETKKDGMATYQDKKVADLKDENGDGHRINEISVDSKLVKKAQKITNKIHAKHTNLICTNLKDHKRQKGRIILPQAA